MTIHITEERFKVIPNGPDGDIQVVAVGATIQGGGVTDHAELDNLAYAASGHTGFAGTGAVANTFTAAQTINSTLAVTGTSTLAGVSATDVTASGTLGVTGTSTLGNITGTGTTSLTGATTLVVTSVGVIPLTVQGALGQTANLTEWKNSAGTVTVQVGGYAGIGGLVNIYDRGTAQPSLFNIHTDDQSPYLARFYNDTYSASSAVFEYFGFNSGNFAMGTSSAKPVGMYVQGLFNTPQFVINGSGFSSFAGSYTVADSNAILSVATQGASIKGFVVKGAAAQTANLQEWQNSSGSPLLSVSSAGRLVADSTGGGADYLTVTPSGNLSVTFNGTNTSGTASYIFQSNGVAARSLAIGCAAVPYFHVPSNGGYQFSSGNVLANGPDTGLGRDSVGVVKVTSGAALSTLGSLKVGQATTGTVGLIVRAIAAATANLQEWQDSAGTVLSSISSAGAGLFSGTSIFRQTGGVAGTDELQVSHNGSVTILESKDGGIRLVPSGTINNNNCTVESFAGGAVRLVSTGTNRLSVDAVLTATGSSTGWQVNSSGHFVPTTTTFNIGVGTLSPTSKLHVSTAAATIGVIVQAAAAQTANLTEWQNSAGTNLFSVTKDGANRGRIVQLTLSSDENDYNPLVGYFTFLDPSGADRNLTGLVAGQDGEMRIIWNVGSANAIVFAHQSGSSTAENRFINPAGLYLDPDQAAFLVYDAQVGRWRITKLTNV